MLVDRSMTGHRGKSGQGTAAAQELLKIDPGRAAAAIAAYLKALVTRQKTEGVLLGLSGGIDSAVLLGLTVRALGVDRVHALFLFDRDSACGHVTNAHLVADWLGVKLEEVDIEAGRAGAYAGRALRVSRLSPLLNRLALRIYRFLAGESAFVSSLRAGGSGAKNLRPGKAVLQAVDRYAEELFYERHRYRREVLENRAGSRNWSLIGAANRTEWELGWFVADGVDDLPYQPLIGLYKTQVRQMAAFLEMPASLQAQLPSPDMARGINDEFALGWQYWALDLGLDCLDGGTCLERVLAAGLTQKDLRSIQEMKALSSWKRKELAMPVPADGGRGGGLRVAPGWNEW